MQEKKGRVSEAGLERLAQRMGLSTYFEDSVFDGRKCKTLFVGGSALELTIVFDNNIVKNVTVGFPMSAPLVARHTEKASQILLRDLQLRSSQSPLTKTLDEFAANLEYLANLDRLSVMPGLDCHEALAGIYENLERLHAWDVASLRDDPVMIGRSDDFLAVACMCTRNGRPAMNERGRVGLGIQYWKERRLTPPETDRTRRYAELAEKVWSIRIACAPTNGIMFQPLRVSDDWISPEIEKMDPLPEEILATASGPVLDWREPPSTMLPMTDESKEPSTLDLASQKLPEVMFVATLDPPVTFSQTVWMQLYQVTGAAMPASHAYSNATFDSIYFPIPTGVNHVPSEHREISCTRTLRVPAAAGSGSEEVRHNNTLFIYKPVYGQTLTELPFSHPRQLVAMLPTLRQYALLSTLLENSFVQKDEPGSGRGAAQPNGAAAAKSSAEGIRSNGATTTPPDSSISTVQDDLGWFKAKRASTMTNGERTKARELNLEVTLTVHPVPRLQVVFPFRGSTANVVLEIRANGVVHVVSQNIVPDEENGMEPAGKGKGRYVTKQDLGKVLELFEDLCAWCEWIRTRLE